MEKLGDILWDITKYLCVCVKQEVDFICNLEENLQSLENKWKKLEAMKKDVEEQIKEAESTGEMRRSHQVSVWLESIQDIPKEVKEIQVQGAQEIQDKCLSNCCPKNCMSSFKLGKNVANTLTKVDHLTAEGQRVGKDYPITPKLPHKPIDQIPLSDTVGLDFTFGKVWDDGIEANNVGIIGLYGTGGVGKTTLLKKICNELGKRRPDFFVIWVVVSKERNLEKIMDNIRKSIGIGDSIWDSCNNQEEKSAKIWGVLKQKKFALLLDDIWEELDLNLVGVPHPKDTNFESKVLFTTRSEDVCAKMEAQPLKVEFLKEKEALELFRMKVGEETLNSHPRIKVLAEEMAAESKGLPLALIVAGSAMAGVKSVEAWECSKNNLSNSSWTSSNMKKRVFSILKLSYDLLPDETHRNCFLYCALYPEDYEIRVNDIVDKWIGEGLLYEDMEKDIQDIRNYGQSVIAKLKLCCLLESVEDDIIVARSFKMHDVVRDMALWLAYFDQDKRMKRVLVQEDAITASCDDVEKLKIVERISIMKTWEVWDVPPVTCPNLVTLLVRSSGIEGLQHIKYFCKLKVLELHAVNVYDPREIGELILLEYLSLQIDGPEIPKELKNLKNLKLFNLLLIDNDIESIPLEVMSSLLQLRVLRVLCKSGKNSKAKVEFLKVVESLPRIEELNVDIKTEKGLEKLLHSHKLQSCIYALRLSGTIEMPLLMECIPKLKRLRQFSLFANIVEDSCFYDTCCLTMLQCVAIIGCHSLKHVTWLKHAPFLQMLIIADCSSMEQVIKQEEEAIKDENVDSSSSCITTTTTFSSLVNLTICYLPELQSIHDTALSFPSLRTIKILDCPNLKKLPFDSNSAKHDKLTLISGEEDWWNKLEWDDPPAKHHFQSKFSSKFLRAHINEDRRIASGWDWIP